MQRETFGRKACSITACIQQALHSLPRCGRCSNSEMQAPILNQDIMCWCSGLWTEAVASDLFVGDQVLAVDGCVQLLRGGAERQDTGSLTRFQLLQTQCASEQPGFQTRPRRVYAVESQRTVVSMRFQLPQMQWARQWKQPGLHMSLADAFKKLAL